VGYIDVAIPGVIGLLLLAWPRSAFLGSQVEPDAKKLRLIRKAGIALVLIAAGYVAIRSAS
jgi:hypothetical protein